MRVAFRVDASYEIGSGHLMRCLTLAEELELRGANVLFLCRNLPGNQFDILTRKHKALLLPTGVGEIRPKSNSVDPLWCGSWQQDADKTKDVLANYPKWDWLVVDHYCLDAKWERTMRPVAERIMVIDDLAKRAHDCDLLLDQNLYSPQTIPYDGLLPSSCRKLLGPRYSLIRREFRTARRTLDRKVGEVRRVLVMFGGVDYHNWTSMVLRTMLNMDMNAGGIQVDVVVSMANPHRGELEEIGARMKNVRLHVQPDDLAGLIADADIGIGAGGISVWERCCLGLPAIAWPVASNQERQLHEACREGVVYVPDSFVDPEGLALHFEALRDCKGLRNILSKTGMRVVDGEGARRVVDHLMWPFIALRKATIGDAHNLLRWRNDHSVLRYCRNKRKLGINEHREWLARVLDDPAVHLLIASYEGEPVGVIRFDVAGTVAEVSIYLVPDKQGQGWGEGVLMAGERWVIQNEENVEQLVAEIQGDNRVSHNLFVRHGYALKKERLYKDVGRWTRKYI